MDRGNFDILNQSYYNMKTLHLVVVTECYYWMIPVQKNFTTHILGLSPAQNSQHEYQSNDHKT